jgi:hypothetical protein
MEGHCFQVGDRVRVRASTVLRVGKFGTIVRSFLGADDLSDVQFDGDRAPYLTLSYELERVRSAEQNASAPSSVRRGAIGRAPK